MNNIHWVGLEWDNNHGQSDSCHHYQVGSERSESTLVGTGTAVVLEESSSKVASSVAEAKALPSRKPCQRLNRAG